ncbi:hypothetical protein SERLA73DRAFT_72031 [Serpula lacrymans var. lacrymans S7.3]|uniref:Uncharacterized protein n=2 Tax=Serpula lacrymans var. lacrymans TaxID=341189 RepID=F8PTR6_SERL3|nr:uncharacterized protein SERLADRAFT_436532 [Serpula lacrymans var. lacrymans S7.9]EGO01061.1 hypothetical protein SERLA73DRAFT_72031 [Serpula lacrymans var. lacrymans S7.3]EGO26718.1 hypothetical protein SERLADRAFT_436532 [Serpula lacrymans var. lacrymans S7.9]
MIISFEGSGCEFTGIFPSTLGALVRSKFFLTSSSKWSSSKDLLQQEPQHPVGPPHLQQQPPPPNAPGEERSRSSSVFVTSDPQNMILFTSVAPTFGRSSTEYT